MTSDPIGDLLTHADATAGPPQPRPGLADRVRTQAQRRRTRARVTAGAVAVLAIAGAFPAVRSTLRQRTTDVTSVPANAFDAARLRQEITALRQEATAREKVVAAMLAGEARGRRPPARSPVDPLQRIRDQQDVAALALVRQADRLYHDLARPQRAAATYERVVELFPQTPWATVARQRLVEIKG
jgi:hypothetical protein